MHRNALLAVCFLATLSVAQIPSINNTTSTPIPGVGHDYLEGLNETVNPANGSLSFRLPGVMPSSRGITLPFSFAYDSNGVNYVSRNSGGSLYWYTTTSVISQAGWSTSKPLVSATQLTWTTTDDIGHIHRCYGWVNYVFQDANGNRHKLDLTVNSDPAGTGPCSYNTTDWPYGWDGELVTQGGEGPIAATTTDQAGQTQAGSIVITDGDGTVIQSNASVTGNIPSSMTDRNGNVVTLNGSSYVDTAGRTVLQDTAFGVSPETVTISGLGAAYTLTWTSLSVPSFSTPITTVTGSCGAPTHGGPWLNAQGTTVKGVTILNLPNQKSFGFTYDSTYGLVNKITYPTGGYVRYVWGMNNNAETTVCTLNNIVQGVILYAVPAITDRYVSFDGTTEALHQHFAYSNTWSSSHWTSKQTTVTTTDNVRGTTFTTVYTYSSVNGDIPPNTGPDTPPQIPVESSVVYNNTDGTLLKTVTKTWQNERLLKSQTTAYAANGQTSQTAYSYDANEMQTEQDDYDFGVNAPGPLLRKIMTSYATFGGNHIVDKPSTIKTYDSSGTTLIAETDSHYDQTTPRATSGVVQHSGGCVCGNLTTKSVWVNISGSTLNTIYAYDDTGQVVSMTDPRSNQTTYSYTDNFSSGGPTGGVSNAYVTTVTFPQTGSTSHIEKYAYAYATGKATSFADQNNLVTYYKYVDNLARLTETDYPDGGQTGIAYNDSAYNPSTPSPSVTTTKKINTTISVVTLSAQDGLGHPIRSELTSDPQGVVYTDTVYDGLGRVKSVSNPYRGGTDPTSSPGTTTYVYDALGRKVTETAPDNSVINTAYCGGSTLVTDPTNRWRRSRSDGLGRLVEVDEPNAVGATVASTGCPGSGEPIWVTTYTIDALGNLKQVLQNGARQRTFGYDFLSRLTSASNPESGTVTYNYDSDSSCTSPNSFPGLLVSKVDARSIRSCSQYDALDRNTSVSYSNGDPTVTSNYDESGCLGLSSCSNTGHRTSVTDAAGSEAWSYQVDPTNHRTVHQNQRTTSSTTKSTTYYLDLSGNVTSITYPTGRVVNYSYSAANRPITAQDSANGITYATAPSAPLSGCPTGAVCYTPQGSIYSMSIGQTASFTGLNVSQTFNNRLQPLEIKASSTAGNALDLSYNFVDPASGHNAGHVYSITNNLTSGRSQTFTYDQLNRILSAGTTSTTAGYCWGYQYSYDPWSNLLSQAAWSPNYNACAETSMGAVTADGYNHITGLGYDASGDTLSDGQNNYTWNAEGEITTAAGVTYLYDGDGRRMSKSSGKRYWYGSGGEILAETGTSGNLLAEYVFFGGRRVAVLFPSKTQYYVEDYLGSSRVITQSTGTVCFDEDFAPFGQEKIVSGACTMNQYKFEGKERDSESGNDDFGARYYASRIGRWLSADWSSVPVPVPYANLTNPQTLNLYAMVADDPESFADLDGHGDQTTGSGNSATVTPGTPCDVQGCKNVGTSATVAQNTNQVQAQNANTIPIALPPPVVLPILDKVVDVVVGGLERAGAGLASTTTAVVGGIAGYLASPNSGIQVCTCSTDQPQHFGPPASTSQQGSVNTSPMEAHTTGARNSTTQTHQEGEARTKGDRERGYKPGTYPRKPPKGWKEGELGNRSGKWPPANARDQRVADRLMGR